jgi:hypothetical protein
VTSVVNSVGRRPGRAASIALSIAAVYAAALVVAAFFAPVYSSASVSSSGEVTQGSGTLVSVNGIGVLPVLAVPLLATVLVGCALWLRARRGAMPFAWTLTGLLAVFNLLAMLSIGLFVLPVTAALVIACVTSRRHSVPLDPAAQSATAG